MKKLYFSLFIFLFAFSLFCNGETNYTTQSSGQTSCKDSCQYIEIGIGQRMILNANYLNDNTGCKWTSSSKNAAILSEKEDLSLAIIGMSKGETVFTLTSSNEKNEVIYIVKVIPKTIKILAIGNSFSVDAVEKNLYDLAKADSIEVIIGNMFIPGCPLKIHLDNARTNSPAYSYRKIVNGKMKKYPNETLKQALEDEDWDYVSLQQASPFSGIYSSYEESLPTLVQYVKQNLKDEKKTTLMFHQTWAYSQDSKHKAFIYYNRDQKTMYDAIADATSKVEKLTGIELIIPSGTAIQNARTSSMGDTFCRDGYHLEKSYGRYTAACTWFEAIFNRTVVGNTFSPKKVTGFQKRVAQNAAHLAVQNPFIVSSLTELK